MAEPAPIIVIDMQEGRYWGDCPMCGEEKRLDHAVGWYEEAVHEDIGTILPHGGEVGGKSVCRECHDRHYAPGAATMTAPTPTAATPEELAASIELVGTEAAQEEIRQDIAAAIRQHHEAQRAEIERLTDALDDVQTAYCNHVMQQPDANAIAQSVADYGSAEAAVKGLHDFQLRVHRTMIDHFKARATTAEAALSAVTAERDKAIKERNAFRDTGKAFVAGLGDRLQCADDALAAALERETALREALERIAKGEAVVHDADDLETDVITTMDEEEMREIARAAIQPQEPHHADR